MRPPDLKLLVLIGMTCVLSRAAVAQGTGTLYFSSDNNSDGLYMLDTVTGAATHIGESCVVESTVGLAPSDDPDVLFGSLGSTYVNPGLLFIDVDGTGCIEVGDELIEGLAYDAGNGVLYGCWNAPQFFTMDPADGTILNALPSPGVDLEGLAFGNGGVYAIAGEDLSTNLYFFDIGQNLWTIVGPTGVVWDEAGLAYNATENVLYAKGEEDTRLFRINPNTGASTVVGDTGIHEGGGLAWVAEQVLFVAIDIKPGSDPNCFNNNGHGVIPVAILGSESFDAIEVDPVTVMLESLSVRVKGNGSLQFSFEDVNADGLLDMVVHILDEDGVFEPGDTSAMVTGQLLDGTPFEGTDSICIVP
ncbi:MAG: hypothetical protein ACYSUA_17115 [Planctomycetota bacterium]|jgi:hypothetical protein